MGLLGGLMGRASEIDAAKVQVRSVWTLGRLSRRVAAMCAALGLATPIYATDWEPGEADDPLVHGAKCAGQMPTSYGSYIYDWPDKYDAVNWPITDANALT